MTPEGPNPAGNRVLAESLRLLRRFLWRAILYAAIVELVTVVILSPVITWALYRILALTGKPFRVNYELLDLLLSPGVVLGLLWLPVVAWVALLGAGGFVLLAASSHEGVRLSVGTTLRYVLRRLALVRGVAVLKMILYFLAVTPVLGAVASGLISGSLLSFPNSALFEIIPSSTALLFGIGIAIAASTVVASWLAPRWGFVAFGVGVEGLPLGAAFRLSVRMGQGRRWTILRNLVMATVVTAIVLAAAAALLGIASGLVVSAVGAIDDATFVWIAALLVTLDIVILSALVSIGGAWLVSISCVTYFRLRSKHIDGPIPRWWADAPGAGTAQAPMWRHAALAGALLIAATAITVPHVRRVVDGLHQVLVITAHRGAAIRAPENTIAAVRAAIEDKADYIEIDIQQAKDGGLILLHDLTLRRTAGRPERAWELTTPELTAIDVGAWFGEAFEGELLPTLAEVIEVARGHGRLNIEIKIHGREKDLAAALITLLEDTQFTENCIVTSLDQRILAEIRRRAPDLRIGLIVSVAVGDVMASDSDMFAVQPLLATREFIVRAHRAGREVHVWSLTEPRNMHMIIDRGADGILTPDPALARRVVKSRTAADDARALLLRLFGRAGWLAPAPEGWE